jgi:hypothetical protein
VWRDAGGDTTVHQRVSEWAPAVSDLKEFEGRYVTPELDTRYKVVLTQGRLLLQVTPSATYPLVPRYRDFFETDLGWIRYLRDPAGHITGLDVSDGRGTDVNFVKE